MMEFIYSLGTLENVLFTFPLVLVLLIALLQVVGLGLEEMFGALGVDFGADVDADVDVDVDVDLDVDVDASVDASIDASDLSLDHGMLVSSLGFFQMGKVPLGFIVEMLLAFFGLAGLAMHTVIMPQFMAETTGMLAKLAVSWPTAAATSVVLTKILATILARVAPAGGEGPTRIRALAGRTGRVVSAVVDATQGRAEVADRKGETHTVFVRMIDGEDPLAKDDAILLIAYESEANYFRASAAPAGARV